MKKELIYSPYRILFQKEKLEKIKKDGWCYPSTFSFLLNDSCNHKCVGCCAVDFKNDAFFPMERVPALIKDLEEMGLKNVEFCGGGEPTLHPNFKEIVKLFHDKGFVLGLITNGSTLNKEIIRLVGQHFNWVRISLDAASAETYKKIHGVEHFERVTGNALNLKKFNEENGNKINLGVRFLLYDFNIQEITSMHQLAKKLGYNNINFRVARNCSNQPTKEQVEFYTPILDRLKKQDISVSGTLEKSLLHTPTCWLHWLWLIVTAKGDVLLCCWYQGRYKEHVVGNVLEESLIDIYRGKKYKEAVSKLDISKCDLYDCRYHKYNEIFQEWLREGDAMLFL